MRKTKFFCDICGEEFDASSRPPWVPELCEKHLDERRRLEQQMQARLYKQNGKQPKAWL